MSDSAKPEEQEFPTHWPLNIGTSKPKGKHVYEFAIVGGSDVEGTSRVLRTFQDHNVRIINGRMDIDHDRGTWSNEYYLDLEHADCNALQLAKFLRLIDSVRNVQHVPRADSIFSFFTFPVMMNDRSRAYIMRAESLYRIEEKLKELMGTGGGAMMFQEGRAFGSGVTRIDMEVLGSSDLETRIKTAKDGSKAAGFGILDYDFSKNGDTVNVTVKEPLVDSSGDCKSHFFFGIIAGVIESIHGVALRVDQWEYHKESMTLRLKFSVEN